MKIEIVYVLFMGCFLVTNAFAMADNTPPVYGVPTLYGEYEILPDDMQRASEMYGTNTPHVAPIRATSTKQANAAKQPTKAKKAAPKKSKKAVAKKKKTNKKPSVKKSAVVTEKVESVANDKHVAPADVVTVVPVDAAPVVPVASAGPSRLAIDIATHAADKVDIESFCIQTKHQGHGNLPDGIIMMPGRPDLMSCVSNNNKN